jgi:hypothetical protein
MAASRSATRRQKDLVFFLIGDDFLHNGGQRLDAPVADGLSPDFDDIDIREKLLLGGDREFFHKRFPYQALTHKPAFYVQSPTIPFSV